MSNHFGTVDGPVRVALIGMPCAETAATLEALVHSGMPPSVLLLSGNEPGGGQRQFDETRRPTVPLFAPGDPAAMARLAGIPAISLGDTPREARGRLASELRNRNPDVAIVACFPWRLTADVLAIPRWGALNVHPSVLPRWRGPEPLFWTFHAGDIETGVTVHRMDEGLDTGPILEQSCEQIPTDAQLPDFEQHLMRIGGQLAANAVRALAAGSATEQPQPTDGATYAPLPTAEDWVIAADWTVERAYRFAKAVGPLGGPLAIETPEGTKPLFRVFPPASWAANEGSGGAAKRTGPVPGTRFVPLADGSLKVIFRPRS